MLPDVAGLSFDDRLVPLIGRAAEERANAALPSLLTVGESLWQVQERADFPQELRKDRPANKGFRGYLRRLDP